MLGEETTGMQTLLFWIRRVHLINKKKQLLHELSHDFPHWIKSFTRTLLVDQWLRFHAHSSGDTGSIPGQGTKIPHAIWCGKKKKNLSPYRPPEAHFF